MPFKIPTVLLVLIFLPFLAFAAIPDKRLSELSIGMKVEEIISILGKPDLRREEGVDADGKTMERLNYSVTRRLKVADEKGDLEATHTCSLMIVDGILIRIESHR